MKLTIGMACYKDFAGVYFSVQALRMYHNLDDTEILIVDNFGEPKLENWVKAWASDKVRYVKANEIIGTSYPRHKVFEEAKGEWVICMDSHVMLMPGSLTEFRRSDHLIHGVMYYDDIRTPVTHMDNQWRDNMWGTWCETPLKMNEIPIEIEMHGLGLFASRRDAWLGFNPEFRGFGGEEGYIHTKYRQAGRKTLLLPWIKWIHKFRNGDIPYPCNLKDRVRNYIIGFNELEMPLTPIKEHFGSRMVDSVIAGLH